MFNKPPSDIRRALLAAAGVKRDAMNEDFTLKGQQMMSQAQGILASDPNLMQEVQRYAPGGFVRGQQDAEGRGIMDAAAKIRASTKEAARRRYQQLAQPPIPMQARETLDIEETFDLPPSSRMIPTDPRELGVVSDRNPDREFSGLPEDLDFEIGGDTGRVDYPEKVPLPDTETGKPSSIVKEVGVSPEEAMLTAREARDKLAGDNPFGGYGFNPEPDQKSDPKTETQNVIAGLLSNNNLTDQETNDIILDAVGAKPKKKLSLDERIKQNQQVFKKYFGKDLEGEKSVDGYNLAYLGFAIAAGESPNAFTNISKGLLAATKRFSDTEKERRKRKEGVTKLAVSEALKSQTAEQEFDRDIQRDKQKLFATLKIEGLRQSGQNNRALAQIIASKDRNDANIKAARERKQMTIESQEYLSASAEEQKKTLAKLDRDLRRELNKGKNFSDAYNSALDMAKRQGFNPKDDDFMPQVIKNMQTLGRASKKTNSNMMTPNGQAAYFGDEKNRRSAIRALKDRFKASKNEKDYRVGKDGIKIPRDPTNEEIFEELRRRVGIPRDALLLDSGQAATVSQAPTDVSFKKVKPVK